MRLRLLALLAVSGVLLADIVSHQKVEVSRTERADFPSGGLLRVEHTTGDLTIEGWDRPDVEITMVQSTRADYLPQEREKVARGLADAPLSMERRDQELVVANRSTKLGNVLSKMDLWTDIKAPFNARIAVAHGSGEVHIDNMTSPDIHVTVANGAITLHLPEDSKYNINAKSDFGGVQSDFPGEERRRWWQLGHHYAQQPSSGRNLYLRVEVGDITILKIRTPPEPTAPAH